LQQNGDWIERTQLIILNECDDNPDHREMDSYGPLELKDSLKKEDTEEANYAIAGESLDVVLDPKKEP
jgi:hypothetical protein